MIFTGWLYTPEFSFFITEFSYIADGPIAPGSQSGRRKPDPVDPDPVIKTCNLYGFAFITENCG